MKRRAHLIWVIFTVFGIANMEGQEESPGEIDPDRPDMTETPRVVPKGFLQVETGFFYEETEENTFPERILGFNHSLLRYGLLENFELRLGSKIIQTRTMVNGENYVKDETGFEPLQLGAKIGIAEEKGLMPEMGFLVHLHLPFAASSQYRPETTNVDFRFAFLHTLSENSNISYNIGAQWLDDSAGAEYLYTLSYDRDISDKFGFYLEIYGEFPEAESANHNWDGGLTYLINNNLQLDILVGTGIAGDQNLLIGGGLSYRIPN